MKKVSFLLLFLFILTLPQTIVSSSYKEIRSVIFSSLSEDSMLILSPGENIKRTISFEQTDIPTRKFLRVTGNIKMPPPFQNRGEEMFRRSEFHIDDNLDSINVKKEQYSLYFKGENNNFERHAYYRISGTLLQPGELTVTIPVVKKKELFIAPQGDFGIEIELYYKKSGRHPDDIYDRPDSLLYLPIPEGSSNKYQNITQRFILPENIACAFLRIGGTHFSGECWVESPLIMQKGKRICSIPFKKFSQKENNYNYWIGCNLSTRSWPRWQLEFNEEPIFEGNIFDRASNVADFYILLPETIKGNGELKLTLLKEPHRKAYPYEIQTLEIIEEPARDFEIINTPKFVTNGNHFGILIETNKPNVHLTVKAACAVSPLLQEVKFEKTGLHVIEFRASQPACNISLEIDDKTRTEHVQIKQIIDKKEEPVYISSGDEVYIDKQYIPYDYFFKWYISNRVGNWYQFRPSYQWSGFRIEDPVFTNHYTQLLNQLNIPYAWQVEGRTFAGKRINPDLETLKSPLFKGKQAHENDGGYYYWQHFLYEGIFSDMAARNRPYGGIFAKHRPIYTDHGIFIHYDPYSVRDMADGAQKFVENLRYSKGESTRHTGPSSLFRYFYQAGYDWLGAEQMYGPEEIILSALRGASRAYGKKEYGTLHAMQWGSYPFTDPKHSLRLYMSLAVAYMHGSSHMNTEEALWTDEFMNDRYSTSGKEHLYAQHQVLDFIETHSRRGTLKSNIAIIQGRNDAWKSFGRTNLWSQKEDKWKFNKACESFDLLNIFYPENIVNGCGPNGWFSSTPYGTIDLLPIEAPIDVMNQYKAMIFLGWNTFDENDFDRIRNYVYNGGTLLLSAVHLNSELQPDLPVKFPTNDLIIREMLGDNYQSLNEKTEKSFGYGKIIYFPQKAYPAEDILIKEYKNTIQNIAENTIQNEPSKGWIKASKSVGFTVWDDSKNRRTLYLLNTDWESEQKEQKAILVYNGKEISLPVRRYHIETIHCAEGIAIIPMNNTTDVLDIKQQNNEWSITIQNTENETILIFNSLTGEKKSFPINKAGIHNISFR